MSQTQPYILNCLQYSKLAAHYDDMSSGQWQKIVKKQGAYLNAFLKTNGKNSPSHILNMTCGRGTQLYGLAEYGHLCTGIDLAKEQIEKAKSAASDFKNGESVKWIEGDALNASNLAGEQEFDLVLSFGNSIALLGDDAVIGSFLEQAFQVLKPQGTLILTGMDYTHHRQTQPHIIQHAHINGNIEGTWIETAEWEEGFKRYISHLTFIYTRPKYEMKYYEFSYLYALTASELETFLHQAGFSDIEIKKREDIKMPGFYEARAIKPR